MEQCSNCDLKGSGAIACEAFKVQLEAYKIVKKNKFLAMFAKTPYCYHFQFKQKSLNEFINNSDA